VAPCEKLKTNGQRFYRLQCPDCGAALSGHLKFAVVDAWLAAGKKLGTWDEEKYTDIIRRRFAASAEIRSEFGWDAYGFWQRYDKYLHSDEWRARRERALNRDSHKCQQPGCRREADHVHHLNYDRVGEELDTDLTSVCFPCHQKLHPDRPLSL
jgi:5-methylcytosine-specific restriction endonuclease McrA